MRPNFTTACLQDIERAREAIAEYSPAASQQFIDNIFDKVEQLLDFPELGRMVPELGQAAVRELFYQHYRIVYRLIPNGRIDVVLIQSGRYPLDENRLL